MLLGEVLGRRGKVGVINILSFLILAALLFMIYQGEMGTSLKDLFVPRDSESSYQFPYCFFLCFLVTVWLLYVSMKLLFKLEEKNHITGDKSNK
jgi:hypothetical protein